jgi:hypothetical protein
MSIAPHDGDSYRSQAQVLYERVLGLEEALRKIQEWDCLNPPDPKLCADHPWLKRHVDAVLASCGPTKDTAA